MKEVKGTVCWYCKAKKRDVIYTGSFLCDSCQEASFEYVRKIVNGDDEVKTIKEQVIELTKKGLSAKEIADKLQTSKGTVYTYRSAAGLSEPRTVVEQKNSTESRTTVELEATATAEATTLSKPDYKKLYLDLQKTYSDRLKQHQIEIEKVSRKFQTENEQLRESYTKLYQEFSISDQENSKLKQQLQTPAEDTKYEQAYLIEKQKHDALLNYLSIR